MCNISDLVNENYVEIYNKQVNYTDFMILTKSEHNCYIYKKNTRMGVTFELYVNINFIFIVLNSNNVRD